MIGLTVKCSSLTGSLATKIQRRAQMGMSMTKGKITIMEMKGMIMIMKTVGIMGNLNEVSPRWGLRR